WTPGSTLTKLTVRAEISHLQTLFVALQALRPSRAQATRLPRTPSAIRSQTFHSPMTHLLVFKWPNENPILARRRQPVSGTAGPCAANQTLDPAGAMQE